MAADLSMDVSSTSFICVLCDSECLCEEEIILTHKRKLSDTKPIYKRRFVDIKPTVRRRLFRDVDTREHTTLCDETLKPQVKRRRLDYGQQELPKQTCLQQPPITWENYIQYPYYNPAMVIWMESQLCLLPHWQFTYHGQVVGIPYNHQVNPEAVQQS